MIPCDKCIEIECDKCPLWNKYKGGQTENKEKDKEKDNA